ncbi:formate dehydrogenase subunit delta [Sedimenticola thiotaurini]|uniref:Formate dehydrogenase n=1 Tax=Sedimenticola thiotaurini TaxID=1543721 RepID=A0A0F7JZ24_9GAMM|nr:formate dehydrogenase subunit delta [Sedimenticola thiotaurini]AKH20135.1 formate dehydrogenase [Sedimenticola thiotaurini]
MNIDRLIKMANQIGTFFESIPDREQALQEIAGHLKKFWDPRMREKLIAHLESSSDSGLTPIVLDSLRAHKSNLVRA